VSSTRRGCFTARVRRVRRRIDDVSIVQRCVSNLSRGTGGLARSVGEEMMFGRGSGLHFSLESCGRRLHAIVARGTYGNQGGAAFRNSQINSDRGDPPFLIWRGDRHVGFAWLWVFVFATRFRPTFHESRAHRVAARRDFSKLESQSERRIFDEQSIQLASRECRRVFSGWGEARGGA